MCARLNQPFIYTNKEEFHTNLVEWIGDVFYDILPEHGYEIRDEQIFTAFQIADAICDKKVHLAEAGLGTGKTFAYLLSAVPYARYNKKPVVIACATSALQEQLAGNKGDIKTLFELLGLEIDARMAKDPSQYICDRKVSQSISEYGEHTVELDEWLSKTKYGERCEIPTIPDYIWNQMSWDESMDCETCDNRGFCKFVKAKKHYSQARDLIIVDHETFFHDLWTREEKILEGKIPILPQYGAVIFDEGHKIMLPAAMQAGDHISQQEVQNMIEVFEEIQGARPSFFSTTMALEQVSNSFFATLSQTLVSNKITKRLSIQRTSDLVKSTKLFSKVLEQLLLELQIEQELYTESLSITQMQVFTGIIERAMIALNRFLRKNGTESIVWVDALDGTFWSVPRDLSSMLNKKLYQKELAVIFTSATLSNEGDFNYMIRTLGLNNPMTSSVGSSFEIKDKVEVDLSYALQLRFSSRIVRLVSLLRKNKGRALILTNDRKEVSKIRKKLKEYELPYHLLWEDMADRGYLLETFKEEKSSILIGSDFWEGIDVPGEALTLLIIWQLPFPSLDPLIEARRREALDQGLDPILTIDYPQMGLKLKQGCGRLIRSSQDVGEIAFLDSVKDTKWEKTVMGALPLESKIK